MAPICAPGPVVTPVVLRGPDVTQPGPSGPSLVAVTFYFRNPELKDENAALPGSNEWETVDGFIAREGSLVSNAIERIPGSVNGVSPGGFIVVQGNHVDVSRFSSVAFLHHEATHTLVIRNSVLANIANAAANSNPGLIPVAIGANIAQSLAAEGAARDNQGRVLAALALDNRYRLSVTIVLR